MEIFAILFSLFLKMSANDTHTEVVSYSDEYIEDCWLRYQRENEYPKNLNISQPPYTSDDYEIDESEDEEEFDPSQIISLMEELDEEEKKDKQKVEVVVMKSPEEIFQYMLTDINK